MIVGQFVVATGAAQAAKPQAPHALSATSPDRVEAPRIEAYTGSINPIAVPMVQGMTATDPKAVQLAQSKKVPPAEKKFHTPPPPDPRVILQGGDDVGTATPIPGLPYSDVGTTVGYANDYDAVCPFGGSTAPDVVYSYAPGSNQSVNITLCGNTAYDSKLYVFENSVGNVIACNDDYCTTPSYPAPYVSSLDRVALTAGNTYYIVVDGYGGDAGDYTFDMEVPPINDVTCPPEGILEGEPDCGDEYVDNYNGGCDSSPWVFQDMTPGDVICAESGTYLYQGSLYRDTDWFRVVFNEQTVVQWKGVAEFPLRLFVISDPGQNCDLTTLGMGDALPCDTARVDVNVPAGTYYMWAGPQVFTGWPCPVDYVAFLNEGPLPPSPPNDNCVDVTPDPLADGQTLTYTGNNTGATSDCGLLGWAEVWFAFTTSEQMDVRIDVCGSPTYFGTLGTVYTTDCPCTAYYFVSDYGWTCDDGNWELHMYNLPAGTYYYPMYSVPPDAGDYELHITGGAPCVVECPPAGIPEGEVDCYDEYVDDFNGGCGASPYVYSPYTFGDYVCGTSGTYLYQGMQYRDTDWYRVELTESQLINFTCVAEFPLQTLIIYAGSEDCVDYSITSSGTGMACDTVRLSALVAAGVYWFWIGPSVFSGVECPSDYVMWATATEPPPNPCDGAMYTNFSLPPQLHAAYATQCDPVYPFQAGVADDFILPGADPLDINQVNLWIGFWNGPMDPANVTAVGVTIYADNNGMPGGHPSGYDPACSHVDDMGGLGIISEQMINPPDFTFIAEPNGTYQLLIPITPVTLDPGVTYWLEVAPVMEFSVGGQVGWTPSDISTGYQAMQIFELLGPPYDTWQSGSTLGLDMAFCLHTPPGCIYISGDINGNGDATPWADISYAIAYFKGTGPPPPGECPDCACDVNGNCEFNGLDVTYLHAYWKGIGPPLTFCPDCPSPQPDPQEPPDGPDWGAPDTIIIGNLDLTPTMAQYGDTVEIPIWVRNDEDVAGLNMAISADDAFITQWMGGTLQEPLTQWDDCGFSAPAPDQQLPGYTAQSVNGWSDLGFGDNPRLNTNGDFMQVASIRLVVTASAALTEDTTQLVPGDIERLHLSAFSDPSGVDEWPPEIIGGLLVIFPLEGCEYIPGDINSNGEVNGVDVQYAVNYFKRYGPPPLVVCPGCGVQGEDLFGAGDVNGTCEFNGVDVQYFVNYLKGLFDPEDTLIFCPSCPPAGR